ncbi:MAG: hypothetical protein BWY77_00567 [bacterium ADurb.Bin431]|nr:MAG: hypothetical protein BWY77_00567 [bacterium ADurb.Bin431]
MGAAHTGVGLHPGHLGGLQPPHLLQPGGVAETVEFPQHQVLLEIEQGNRLRAPRLADEGDHHLRGDVGRLDEEALTRLELEGVADDGAGECGKTRIWHVFSVMGDGG